MSIENRVVVITGATGGLGRVVARQMAAAGARLALFSTNLDHLQPLAAELGLPADRMLVRAVDLRAPDASREAAQATLVQFGQVDILLHLVGGWTGGTPITELAPSIMDEMLQQHLWTTLNLMQAFVPPMLTRGWGRLVAISSPFATRPQTGGSAYAVGKAAQEALFVSLAEEVQDTGVTANLLLVRSIDTQHERDQARTAKTAAWTTPEEIAAALTFLCSDAAGAINGARIPLYGRP